MSHVWQPGMTLEYCEKIAIVAAIKFYRGNKTQTALSLGISVRTLDTKLEKYDADNRAVAESENRQRAASEDYLRRSRGLSRTASGVLLESSTPAVAKHTVPVPEREEIQEVLPRDAGESRPKRVRKGA